MGDLVFPDGFLWGASTSGYQIEGGVDLADWVAWEQAGRTRGGSAGAACDSWNRWREDIELCVELGLNSYRMGCEWARIEPEPGRFDEAALARYAEMLAVARGRGLTTMLVLWHFTLPSWFADRGGWFAPDAAELFARYCERVADAVAPHVDLWATLNEANTFVGKGWIEGIWPPGRRNDYPAGYRLYKRMAGAHRLGRRAIKRAAGEHAQVGLTHVFTWVHPAQRGGAFSGPTRARWNYLANTGFVDQVRHDLDWLGMQYYHDMPCRTFDWHDEDGTPRTDMGWRIVPEGLYRVLAFAGRRYPVPLYVTENGIADAADRQRGRFLIDHLAWAHKALVEGIDLRGYFHWSLLDNFEWAEGFDKRFGLVAVDHATCERTVRDSARLYTRIVTENRIAEGLGADLTYADGSGSLGPR